jgi:serine/threonine-protein kinase RsbW
VTVGSSPPRRVDAPALPDSLGQIHDVVLATWSERGDVPMADRIRFETAVMEIAANVVEHARPARDGDTVTMSFALSAGAGTLQGTFEDDGEQSAVRLDQVSMPGPDAENGRGLALASALSDDFRYERAGSANRWTVVCRFTPSPGR